MVTDPLVPSAARVRSRTPRRRTPFVVGVLLCTVAVVVAVLLAPILRGSPGSSSQGDYPYYATTAELEGVADLIVRGTITSTTRDRSAGYPRVVATVDVTAAAKGPVAPGTTLEIAYTTGGPEARADVRAGGEYVILLDDLADLEGDWPPTPVNLDQGFYTVVDDQAVADPDNPVSLSPETLQALGLG